MLLITGRALEAPMVATVSGGVAFWIIAHPT